MDTLAWLIIKMWIFLVSFIASISENFHQSKLNLFIIIILMDFFLIILKDSVILQSFFLGLIKKSMSAFSSYS